MVGVPTPTTHRGRRRSIVWLATVAGLAGVVMLAAATLPGPHPGETSGFGRARVARPVPPDRVRVRDPKVFGSNLSAARYGRLIGLQENQGVDSQGQLSSDLPPLPARAFRRPVAEYKRYAERWSVALGGAVNTLATALASGDRTRSRRAWATAFADYLHLGAVYGLLPNGLNQRLAGLPPDLDDAHFEGLHRIELGLWTGADPRSLVPAAQALGQAVVTLRRVLPGIAIDPLDYATRAHEILEDAQRDFMSGTGVPWSGAGVLGTEAGVIATREVITTLVPLLEGRDNTLVPVQNWLGQLQGTLTAVRRPDGTWPPLQQLTRLQRERIDGTLSGTLGALELVPGTLETTAIPDIPTIASQERR